MKKKFGIIGNPIKHSLSPILHNYWFDKYKIDAEYSIIQIEDSELSDVIEKIKNKDLHGINITLPFKQKIVPYLNILVNDAEINIFSNIIKNINSTIIFDFDHIEIKKFQALDKD